MPKLRNENNQLENKQTLDIFINSLSLQNDLAIDCIKIFYYSIVNPKNCEVENIFHNWIKIFGKLYNFDVITSNKLKNLFRKSYRFSGEIDILKLVFSIHTYYALICKFLALKIILTNLGKESYLKEIFSFSPEFLKEELKKIEEGKLFRKIWIQNYPEDSFFNWYLISWNNDIFNAVKNMTEVFITYDFEVTNKQNSKTMDLLKNLYLNIIPKGIRHSIGEYYTPEWLAEFLLNEINYEGDINTRILDPSCGSGTFLIHLIEIIKNNFNYKGLNIKLLLSNIIKNVVGFDLNPLAVLTAKTNYIIALNNLIKLNDKQFNIPVYLCDSLKYPELKQMPIGKVYEVITNYGNLYIPSTINDSYNLQEYFYIILHNIQNNNPIEVFVKNIKNYNFLIDENISKFIYSEIKELKEKNNNNQFYRDIFNNIAPIMVGQFDIIIGNPPWINWEYLSKDYRTNLKHLFNNYNLLTTKIRVGAIKIDISALFIYRSIDKYLKKFGKLGFIITQTLFKSKSTRGFRKFLLPDNTPIKVIKFHDLVDIQPFETALNRTSIVIMEKGLKTHYPIKYYFWKKKKSIRKKKDLDVEQIKNNINIIDLWAMPILLSDPDSPWIAGSLLSLEVSKKITGRTKKYKARHGTNTGGASGIFWIKINEKTSERELVIENLSEEGRKKMPKIENIKIERDLIYPLLRGKNIKRWNYEFKDNYIIVPHNSETGINALPENIMKKNFPKTLLYFESEKIKSILSSRRAFKYRWGGSFKLWYSLFEIGDYTFTPYKVAYKGQVATKLIAVVISSHNDKYLGRKMIVPDQTVTFIPLKNKEEAFFVCAFLNSNITRLLYRSLLYKHPSTYLLEYLKIPEYNPNNEVHNKISELCQKAHKFEYERRNLDTLKIEKKIDEMIATIYSFNERDILEINNMLSIFNK